MKRIMDGKAYNTDTALHVARASFLFDKGNEELRHVADLYRTAKGGFFLVEADIPAEFDEGSYAPGTTFEGVTWVTFSVFSYDQAHAFVRGQGNWKNIPVELLAEDIFPSVEEGELLPPSPNTSS